MRESKMNLINRYVNTMDAKLNEEETDLLYKVLSRPDMYNDFLSETYVSCHRDQDDQRTITGATYRQYKIIFEGSDRMCIDYIHKYEGEDGSVDDAHWSWDNAETSGYDIREVLSCLEIISWEL